MEPAMFSAVTPILRKELSAFPHMAATVASALTCTSVYGAGEPAPIVGGHSSLGWLALPHVWASTGAPPHD